MPASIAARMIEVPAGTVTSLAVDRQRDLASVAALAGVP